MLKFITISPKTVSSELDEVLRLEMHDFVEVQNRRISVLKGLDEGIIQDYGIHDIDKTFTGSLRVTLEQAVIIKNIKESSTSIWHFGVDSDLYEIVVIQADKSDMDGDKVIIDVVFQVSSKVE